MEGEDTQATALRNLRGMAHPTRYRLLEELSPTRARNVKDLAAAVGEAANSVSFHLRQLAKYDLALQAPPPEGASKRESFWLRTELDPIELTPSTWKEGERPTNLTVLRTALTQSALARIDGIVAVIEHSWDSGARADGDAVGLYDHDLRLTEAEAQEFRGKLRQLWQELKAASDAHGDGDGASRWVATSEFFPDVLEDRRRGDRAPSEPPA